MAVQHTPPKFNSEFTPEKWWERKTMLSDWDSETFQGLYMFNFGRVIMVFFWCISRNSLKNMPVYMLHTIYPKEFHNKPTKKYILTTNILLMEEILHQLIWRIYPLFTRFLSISGGFFRRIFEPSTGAPANLNSPGFMNGISAK